LPAAQTITFNSPGNQYANNIVMLNGSATSGLPIVWGVMSGPASLSGNALSFTGSGNVTISASQPGSNNYAAAAPVTHTITVMPTVPPEDPPGPEIPPEIPPDDTPPTQPVQTKTFVVTASQLQGGVAVTERLVCYTVNRATLTVRGPAACFDHTNPNWNAEAGGYVISYSSGGGRTPLTLIVASFPFIQQLSAQTLSWQLDASMFEQSQSSTMLPRTLNGSFVVEAKP
jgi:hypothetical protein